MRRSSFIGLALAIATAITVGCGGGGMTGLASTSGGGTTGGTTGSTPTFKGTAHFSVNVKTGKVTVTPNPSQTTKLNGKVFAGTAMQFNSSLLLDQPGDTGRKVVQVSVTNNSGETIGAYNNGSLTGFNVTFGPITTGTNTLDLRNQVQVSTVAGSSYGNADGSGTSAQFRFVTGTAVGADGAVYVADKSNNEIRKISNGFVSTLAGNGSASSLDGVGKTATFNVPMGVAYNPADNSLVVAELNGNRIRRVTTDGRVTTIAGNGTAGETNGTGAAATFNSPTSVAVDSQGHIFVSEDSCFVRKISLTPGADPRLAANYTVSTFAGTTLGFADGSASVAKFTYPRGLACDPNGNVFVADYGNHRIRRISPTGEVTTIAGTSSSVTMDGPGNIASFKNPNGLAYFNGALFVADYGGAILRQVSPLQGGSSSNSDSWVVTSIAGTGIAGNGDGTGDIAQFSGPFGIAADKSGNLFVGDFSNFKIRKVVPVNGTFPLGIPNGVFTSSPVELANLDGDIPFTKQPFIAYANSLAPGQTSDSRAWEFVVPAGITAFEFDVTVESSTPLLSTFDVVYNSAPGVGSPNNIVRTFTGSHIYGFQDGTASEARLESAGLPACDANGVLYFPDGNNCIRRVDRSGRVTTIIGLSHVYTSTDGTGDVATSASPNAVAVSRDGTVLYFTDGGTNKVRRAYVGGGDPSLASSWVVSTIAGNGTGAELDGTGNTAEFNLPYGIALSPSGILYVTDLFGNSVRQISLLGADPTNPTDWTVKTVIGTTLANPHGIAVDRDGVLYVADSGNDVVRKIDPVAGQTTLAGTGTAGEVDGAGASAEFQAPLDLVIDPAGYLYVLDNRMIRRISPDGQVATVAGNYGATSDQDGTGATGTVWGTGITMDPAGALYVTANTFKPSYSATGTSIKIIEHVIGSGTSAPVSSRAQR